MFSIRCRGHGLAARWFAGLTGWPTDFATLHGPQLPVNWSQVHSRNSAQLDGQLFSSNHPFNSALTILTVIFDTFYINWMDGHVVEFPWWDHSCVVCMSLNLDGFHLVFSDNIKTLRQFRIFVHLYCVTCFWIGLVNYGLTRVLKIPQRLSPKFCLFFTMNTL